MGGDVNFSPSLVYKARLKASSVRFAHSERTFAPTSKTPVLFYNSKFGSMRGS